MSKPVDGRVNPVFKAMNRPLTVLGRSDGCSSSL